MDQESLPGSFILEAAESGQKAAATLSSFAPKADLASKLSLSATLLSQIGKELNENADCFKENFQRTFEHVPMKCKKEYETVLVGLEKAMAWKKDEAVEGTENAPKKPWKRFLSAMNMDKYEFEDFERSLEELSERASMLQCIVSLIVLQIRAQKQQLTPSELNNLGRLKKNMGKLLEMFRESEVASVVAFGLSNLTKAANAVQILEAANSAAETCSDDTSSISATSTILNPSLDNFNSAKKEIAPVVEPIYPPKPEDKYEMYRASFNSHVKKVNQTVFRLLGIPIKIDRTSREVETHLDRIPATTEEIRAFIAEENNSKDSQPTTLKSLVEISINTSTAIYGLINKKNEERSFPRREWTAELLVPYGKKGKKNDGYVIVLRGGVTYRPFSRPGPPGPSRYGGPPPGWPGSGPPVIVNLSRNKREKKGKREQKPAAEIELTQQETETVINDFLASFSTLYDGISVEERGAALKAIDLDDVDGIVDYDSDDSSSSCSSRSLVDD